MYYNIKCAKEGHNCIFIGKRLKGNLNTRLVGGCLLCLLELQISPPIAPCLEHCLSSLLLVFLPSWGGGPASPLVPGPGTRDGVPFSALL